MSIDLKQELAELSFITRAGNWLFLLLARMAEPLMFLSVLYVTAETVLPGLFKTPAFLGISSTCVIVLNTAPEVILPGCFMQAKTAPEGQGWLYRVMGVVFILLTFVTLAGFIWAFPASAISVIMFFRCAAGVLYSLIVRMTPQSFPVSSETPASIGEETMQIILGKLAKLDQLEQAIRGPVAITQEANETPLAIAETHETEVEQIDLSEQLERLLTLSPDITSREAAAIVGRPHSTVYRQLNKLKQTA